jgi:hypothetical protein
MAHRATRLARLPLLSWTRPPRGMCRTPTPKPLTPGVAGRPPVPFRHWWPSQAATAVFQSPSHPLFRRSNYFWCVVREGTTGDHGGCRSEAWTVKSKNLSAAALIESNWNQRHRRVDSSSERQGSLTLLHPPPPHFAHPMFCYVTRTGRWISHLTRSAKTRTKLLQS